MTPAEAQSRLVAGRAVFVRSKGRCAVYWSYGDGAWVRLSPADGGLIRLELVADSSCPC